jgi:hypothetical protein
MGSAPDPLWPRGFTVIGKTCSPYSSLVKLLIFAIESLVIHANLIRRGNVSRQKRLAKPEMKNCEQVYPKTRQSLLEPIRTRWPGFKS